MVEVVMQKYFYLYKITNKLDGKIYIGAHSTYKLNDGYMGSGAHIKNAIAKYGIENFEKEILQFFDNQDDLYQKEADIVNEAFIKRKDVYNLQTGGDGGKFGIKQSEDVVNRRVNTLRSNGTYDIGSKSGTNWITNGEIEKSIKTGEEIPPGWTLGRLQATGDKISETMTGKDYIIDQNKRRRAKQQEMWDADPELFESVKQKREATRAINGEKKLKETGRKIILSETDKERSDHCKLAARKMHEKMDSDPEYRARVLAKKEETRKRNQKINGYKQKPKN